MKNSKLIAAAVAAALAASMVAMVPASADSQTLTLDDIHLDASSDATKMVQIPYEDLYEDLGEGYLSQVTFTATIPDDAGWTGGGGAFGLGYDNEDWYQVDFGFEVEDTTVVDGNVMTVTIDLPAYYQDKADTEGKQDFSSDGLMQFGWWWGAGDVVDITGITLTYDTEYPEPEADDKTPDEDEKTDDEKTDDKTPDEDEKTDDEATTDEETTDGETTDAETTDEETSDAETTDDENTNLGDDGKTTDAETTDGQYRLGDVNADGRIDVTDLIKIVAHVKSKQALTDDERTRADMDASGRIDVTDISILAKYIKSEEELPDVTPTDDEEVPTDDETTTDETPTDEETTDEETTDEETTDAETTDAETTDEETTDAETTDAEDASDDATADDADAAAEADKKVEE